MGKLFRNKYHIGSFRYKGYDYSSPGRYFVTICTKNRQHFFGEIENREMILSETGKIAQQILIAIPAHFPYAGLDEFVIMPDHIHAIIIINDLGKEPDTIPKNGDSVDPLHATGPQQASAITIDCDKKPLASNMAGKPKNMHMSSISPSSGSLATIIRSFKSAVTKEVHETNPDFGWLSKYHDHIIRTDIELARIRNYIKLNPEKWNR